MYDILYIVIVCVSIFDLASKLQYNLLKFHDKYYSVTEYDEAIANCFANPFILISF